MKTALIGLGPHGRRVLDVVLAMPTLTLTAVVERTRTALDSLEIPEGIQRCESLDELAAHQRVDLVCIATNGPSHAALAISAMSLGARYIMVEKPMACSVAECNQILAKAAETTSRVVVNHSRRFAPVYRFLHERIASGVWGKPRCIWIQRPGIGLGCNATHSFDTMAFLLGRQPTTVTGWVDKPVSTNPRGVEFVDPGGLVVMDFGEGVRGVVAQIEDGSGPTSVEIDCTGARIRLDERSGDIEIIERDLNVCPGPGRPAVFHPAELPPGLSAKPDMGAMIRACLDDLTSDSPMVSDARHGKLAIEVLVAAYLSQEQANIPIKLPLRTPEEQNRWLPVT